MSLPSGIILSNSISSSFPLTGMVFCQLIILTGNIEYSLSAYNFLRVILDFHLDRYLLVGHIRIHLHVVYVNRINRHKLDVAQNSVPVNLSKFGMGVVPFMCLILKAVIHTYREQMLLTGLYVLGDVMVVWHADVVLLAGSFSTEIGEVGFTYIYRTKPMCTFKVQENLLSFPFFRNINFTLIPGSTYTRTFGSDGQCAGRGTSILFGNRP